MKKAKREKQEIFYSMKEFEQEFLPTSHRERLDQQNEDAQSFGEKLANESLEKIRTELSKK